MKTILIFEPLSGGHRSNFIRWLREAAAEYSDCRFVFFTADDITDSGPEPAGWWARQMWLHRLLRQACKQHSPDHALILELTHLELPLILFGSPVPISAILFVQYPELPVGLKRFSKHWKTRLLLWRTPVRHIFLLNGGKSCEYLAAHFGARARFIPVADPAPEVDAEPGFSFHADGKRVCLFFGAVSRRKGADILLNTLSQVSGKAALENQYVFCGEPEPDYRDEFEQSVDTLRKTCPDLNLVVVGRFVSDGRMAAMFEQAGLILMPYVRPEYSSGILAVAARAGTPVLGPPGGLLGRLIRENGLGLAAELTPEVLAQPVTPDEARCREFTARNTIENFTNPILNAVCNER